MFEWRKRKNNDISYDYDLNAAKKIAKRISSSRLSSVDLKPEICSLLYYHFLAQEECDELTARLKGARSLLDASAVSSRANAGVGDVKVSNLPAYSA